MRKLNIFLAAGLLLFSCEKREELDVDPLELTGTWQLVAEYQGNPGEHYWADIKNGHVFTFRKNGTFTSNRILTCETGMYQVGNETLTLIYDCEGFSEGSGDPPGTYVEKFSMRDGYLYLTPTYLLCDEGCGSRYKKISDTY